MTQLPPLPPPPSSLPPPGWYPDPASSPGFRWWDGARWTEHAQSERPVAPNTATSLQVNGRQRILASWWRRAGGYFIDDVIITIPNLLVQALMGALLHQGVFIRGGFGSESVGHIAARIIVDLALAAATYTYAALFIRKYGGTIGMQAVGIEAVDQQSGARLTVAQCWRRVGAVFLLIGIWGQLGFIIKAFYDNPNQAVAATAVCSALAAATTLLTFLWAAGNADNQTLQDKVAGSIVVLTDKR